MGDRVPQTLFIIPGEDHDHIDYEDDSTDVGYPSQDVPYKSLAHINRPILLVHNLEFHYLLSYCGIAGAALHDNKIQQI